MVPPVYFGIAGWSYPDWDGTVYPVPPAGERVRDKLAYVAAYVDAIEINSSFYRPPAAAHSAAWAKSVAPQAGFFFTAKLNQEVTHEGRLDAGHVRAYIDGFRPLQEAGRLRQLLAQFRHDFADSPRHREHLAAIAERFSPLAPLVVEVRHNSWQGPGALAFLDSLGVTVANLDYPTARDSFTLRECRVGADRYLRLHGRNRAAWFNRQAGRDETYNYLYSPEELRGIVDRLRALQTNARSITVIANNHFRGKELANTLELKASYTGQPVSVPPALLAEYPRLRAIAADLRA